MELIFIIETEMTLSAEEAKNLDDWNFIYSSRRCVIFEMPVRKKSVFDMMEQFKPQTAFGQGVHQRPF